MSRVSYLLFLLSLVTTNIYIVDSYTLTASVLNKLGYNNQSTNVGISDDNIDKIDSNAFNGYDKLSILNINCGSLQSIDMEVFKDAVNLNYLTLTTISLNKFTNSKNIILPNLVELKLSSNLTSLNKAMFNAFPALANFDTAYVYGSDISGSLKTVDVHTFESLSNLKGIDMRFNLLTGFEYLQIPPKLQQLNLAWNNMNYFALSRTMSVLDILDISNNRFRSFKSMNFTFLANLRWLFLGNNPHAYPYEIAGHLKPLVKLERVDLANLNITSIDSNYFKNNTNLQYIDLRYNKISTFDYRAFNGLNDLKGVLLNNNMLTNISSGTFNNSKLNYIDLFDNKISRLDSGAFSGLNDLIQVTLYNNNLTKISSGTFNNSNLIYIFLSGNQISQIDSLSFYGYSYSTDVYLYDNKITKILPRTFNNRFSYINLNYNQITEIENSMFDGISVVKSLGLSYNKIEKIAPGSFNIPGLNSLDLSSNILTEVRSGSFAGQNELRSISLYNNTLSTIEPGAFANLPNLQNVFLDNNQLTQLNSSIFAGSNNLLGIFLTGNPNLSTANIQSLCPPAATQCHVYY